MYTKPENEFKSKNLKFFVDYETRRYEFKNNTFMRMIREVFPGEAIGEQALI
jgi:hypothetical protein